MVSFLNRVRISGSLLRLLDIRVPLIEGWRAWGGGYILHRLLGSLLNKHNFLLEFWEIHVHMGILGGVGFGLSWKVTHVAFFFLSIIYIGTGKGSELADRHYDAHGCREYIRTQ